MSVQTFLAGSRRRRSIGLRDAIVLCAVVVLCATVLVFTQLRHRELVRQRVCKSNLGQIGSALYTYADENRSRFAVAAHPEATEDRVGKVEYVRAIGSYRGRSADPQAGSTDHMSPRPEHLSTTRNLWTLFRLGLIERDRFICPSTKDVANQEPNAKNYWDFGIGDIEGPATPEQSRVGYSQVSYGYQMPYGKQGQPDMEHDKPGVVADKGPFGAAFESDAPLPSTPLPKPSDPLRVHRVWNSPNHNFEGQNLLYGGSWSDFQPMSTAGWASENIYTQYGLIPAGSTDPWIAGQQGTGPSPGARLTPAPIHPRHAHYTYDTLIYP